MLYRPPRVLLTVFTRSGRAYGGRLLPATRAGDLCEFESELARSAASSRIIHVENCGHAPQTGVFWTLLLSRAAAVGLFAQCLIDKPH